MVTVILEPKKIKYVTVSIVSPSTFHEVMGPDAMIFVFRMLSFKSAFSLFSFTFIKRLFSSSSLSVISVLSSAYLKLLIFLPAILIPAYTSSSPAFLMMYTAYKLNKQDDNIQLYCTSFLILNQSIVPYLVLTIASWSAHKFLRKQVKWSGILISLKIFHNFLWSTQSKALAQSTKQKQMFLWNSLGFFMIQWKLTIWSQFPLPFLSQTCIPGSCWLTYYWSLLERFWTLPC